MQPSSEFHRIARLGGTAAIACAGALFCMSGASAAGKYGLGTPATPEQIAGWNITIFPDGQNLPPGSGTVAQGKNIYAQQCVACHGAKGEGGIGDRLAGGQGSLNTAKPVRTVGSFWPYATTLYDYIYRAMPITAPQTLTPQETYAVTAYVLFLNGLAGENDTVDAKTLTNLKMPNRDGFVPDPRPDVGPKATAAASPTDKAAPAAPAAAPAK